MFAIRQRASRIVITRQTVVLSRHVAAIARYPGCRALCRAAGRRGDAVAVVVGRGDAVRLRCSTWRWQGPSRDGRPPTMAVLRKTVGKVLWKA